MIDRWFEDDINKVLTAHRYVVVTDARGEGEFLMKHLPDGVRRIDITDEFSEIEARKIVRLFAKTTQIQKGYK